MIKIITGKLLLLALLLTILTESRSVYAQQGDHLVPVGSSFGYEYDYHSRIRKVLFEGISDVPVVQFIVLPPFGGESILVIEADTSTLINGYIKGYNLVYHYANGSIWHENVENCEVTKYKKKISKEYGDLIVKLFDSAISKIRYKNSFGLDGVTYYFSTTAGLNAGKTRSPQEGTKMAKLVEIGHDLIQLAKDGNETVEFDALLVKKIETLTAEFN